MPVNSVLQSEQDILEIVRKFEQCIYLPHEFHHDLHVAVIAWYLIDLDTKAALSRIRANLLRFTALHRVQGYHETITRFWVEIIAGMVRLQTNVPPLQVVRHAVERFAHKDLIYEYYSPERLQSTEARERWMEPDREQLSPQKKEFK